MKTSLPYIVECRANADADFFPIAAFDVMSVALTYKADCERSNRRFEYRIRTEHSECKQQ